MSNHALGLRTPDVETDVWSIECKEREKLPAWLHKAMAQARTNATPGKLPLVILHQKGERHDNDMVVVRLADWEDWYGEVEEGQ